MGQSSTPWLVMSLFAALGYVLAMLGYWHWRRLRKQIDGEAVAHRRNTAIVETSGEGVLEIDADACVRYANPTALRLLGYEADELVGMDYRQLLGANEPTEPQSANRLGYTTDMLRGIGAVLRCKNGRNRPIEYRMVPVQHANARASLLTFRDLTERSRVDIMLADMQHLAKVGAWELNVESSRLTVSESIRRHLKLTGGQALHSHQLMAVLTRASRHQLLTATQFAIVSGRDFALELQLKDGKDSWIYCIGKAERIGDVTVRLYGALQDVTERKRAERVLRETRDFFGATLDAMPSLVIHIDARSRVTYRNQSSLATLLGFKHTGAGVALNDALDVTRFTDLHQAVQAALHGEPGQFVRELTTGNKHYEAQFSFVPEHNAHGEVCGCFMVMTDVTELKMLQARLRQAEKMQAIGQLTGGVAHDFNNLLGVILGNLQLIERDVDKDPAVVKKLSTAMRAAMRGADLTRRLLTFARRQAFDPSIVNLNRQLTTFTELLQRSLGEAVEMRLQLEPELWHTRVDPNQLENAILNLAINARDAMPDGGQLEIKARNVRPGPAFFREHPELPQSDYIAITVNDTGNGIPSQLLSRIFEPFFTTKESGKGSGLGLSIVDGFAKQSGGAITAESTPGVGTTMTLYLPRCDEDKTHLEDTLVQKNMPGGHETILVVEDDTDLRATTVLALQSLGYRVMEASSSNAAIKALTGTEQIDMLFTDVFMPGGMLGPELAARARLHKPNIHVLYTTGYAADTSPNHVGPLMSEEVLAKPYRNEELALKIRHLLD